MKKLLLSLMACVLFMSSIYAHELTETEKKQASTIALAMTGMDVFCLCTITPLTYECFSMLASQLLTSDHRFIGNFIKGAGFGVGLISAAGFSELLKIVCLKDPKIDYNADAINALASEKNIKHRKEILGSALLGGVLGAICMK